MFTLAPVYLYLQLYTYIKNTNIYMFFKYISSFRILYFFF